VRHLTQKRGLSDQRTRLQGCEPALCSVLLQGHYLDAAGTEQVTGLSDVSRPHDVFTGRSSNRLQPLRELSGLLE
jgi:hypothetical protein